MEHSTDSRVSSIHTGVGGSVLDPDLPGPLNCGQSKSEGAVLVQLREFKTHLLEAVEELRACRDAEARFKEQISKLVSEKQELQWAKETLQHQSESVAKQQMESLNSVKKQFQAKIKSVEEEKGKYKVSIEIKNKEINSLKEELKSLQLLKVNLEKRICELEQTLLVQSKATGSQLTKLGEVEKHFSTLSKQCAMVTQAHEKLQHNVDEAIKRNVQLASANAKQEEVITSLKKETKMMKTFLEENAALTQEKLDVVRSLQQTHELLLSQTQAVSRAELELQKKDEQYQALRQEHEVMREKSKALEDELGQLTEKYTACKRDWDKEKAALLEHINKAQQDLLQKHNEPSWQVQVQAQDKKESRSSSRSCSVSTKLLPAEGLVDSKVAAKLAGATGGQNTFSHHQQFKSVTHQNQFTCTPDRNNVFCSLSGGSDGNTIQHFSRSLANQSDPDTMPTSASNVDGREMDQTTEHANRSKDSQMSGENAKNNQEPEIPLKNRDGNETDGKEERQVHTPQEPKY